VPLLSVSGRSGTSLLSLDADLNVVVGLVQLVAVVGAIVAIATRPASVAQSSGAFSDPSLSVGRAMPFIGPLIGGIAFVAGSASHHLGVAVDGIAIGIASIAITAALAFADRLPVVDAALRRVLVMPFILVCAGIFDGFAAEILAGIDLDAIIGVGQAASGEIGFVLFILVMLVGGLAAFYSALVAAPRQLADPERIGLWPVRFVLFLVSALTGIGWLTLLAT
jgi:hypothetical protein